MKHHTDPADVQAAADPQPAASSPDWLNDHLPPPPDPPDPPAAPEVTVEQTPDDEVKPGDPLHARARDAAARTTGTWLGIHRQPPSVRDAWDMSSVIDRNRVPGESGILASAWWLMNRTERIAVFAAIFVLLVPLSILLYCAYRPTHRIGLYIVLLLIFVIIPAIAGG